MAIGVIVPSLHDRWCLRGAVVVGLCGLSLWVTGCARFVHQVESEPSPAHFSRSGDAVIPDRWWQALGDAALSEQIESALESNFSLVAAWERLTAARAIARQAGAARSVSVAGTAEAGLSEHSENGTTKRFAAGLEASYELDLWGRIRSRADAEALRATAAISAYEAAALSLSAEVALAWYDLVEAKAQFSLLADQLETNETVLTLLRSRFRSGLIHRADVLRQRQLVEATREQMALVNMRIGVAQHRLAVLKGIAPQAATLDLPASIKLPALPPLPSTGLPAELVERRPDVRQAYLTMQASDQELAAAISERYPRISLGLSVASVSDRASDLFSDWLTSLIGDLVVPLVDGGRRKAQVEEAAAGYRERVADYRQTVLDAYEDVENALAREINQLKRVDHLASQAALAQSTYEQLRVQHRNGVSNFLDVLDALAGSQRLQRNLSSARLELLTYRLALYRALAGGFDHAEDRRKGATEKGEHNHE